MEELDIYKDSSLDFRGVSFNPLIQDLVLVSFKNVN
jgi:hypothetical protein